MASLYQSRSLTGSTGVVGVAATGWSIRASGEVVELLLARLPAADAEDVRRADVRIELDIVVPAAPDVTRVAQEIVNLEGLSFGNAEDVQVEIGPTRLSPSRIEIDHHQHRAALLAGRFAVAEELCVVDAVKAQVPVEVKRGIVAPSRVHAGDEIAQASGLVETAVLDLVLLGIEVLLAAGLARTVLAQLVGGAIDAVVRGERGRQRQAGHERGPP